MDWSWEVRESAREEVLYSKHFFILLLPSLHFSGSEYGYDSLALCLSGQLPSSASSETFPGSALLQRQPPCTASSLCSLPYSLLSSRSGPGTISGYFFVKGSLLPVQTVSNELTIFLLRSLPNFPQWGHHSQSYLNLKLRHHCCLPIQYRPIN